MTAEEFSLHYHELKLEVELLRRIGKSFQDLFEQIMQKAEPTFLMIKPMGRQGDWKADGYSVKTATIYQCYAPEDMTAAAATKKVKDDFEGAKARWKNMKRWIFVWSSSTALPPQVVAALEGLKTANLHLTIEHLGRAALWNIVKTLSLADREALFGIVPNPNDASVTTAAEIQVLMKHLGSRSSGVVDKLDLDLTAIVEKLQRNGLSTSVTMIVKPAVPVAKLVREFVTAMPNPDFSQAIAEDLARQYSALSKSENEPDIIFGDLIDYALGEYRMDPKFFWAAAGIVTHYFELCDVFQR